MKNFKRAIISLALLLVVPATCLASGSHDHGQSASADAGDHDTMSVDGKMAIVGSMSSKGVKGMAHIKDVKEAMSKMGMNATHHFMIAFVDEETGEQVEKGRVALKLINPDAKSETIELIGMDGHFGADIVLDMKGEYHFRLGTKLEDGIKRKYHFHHVN